MLHTGVKFIFVMLRKFINFAKLESLSTYGILRRSGLLPEGAKGSLNPVKIAKI